MKHLEHLDSETVTITAPVKGLRALRVSVGRGTTGGSDLSLHKPIMLRMYKLACHDPVMVLVFSYELEAVINQAEEGRIHVPRSLYKKPLFFFLYFFHESAWGMYALKG